MCFDSLSFRSNLSTVSSCVVGFSDAQLSLTTENWFVNSSWSRGWRMLSWLTVAHCSARRRLSALRCLPPHPPQLASQLQQHATTVPTTHSPSLPPPPPFSLLPHASLPFDASSCTRDPLAYPLKKAAAWSVRATCSIDHKLYPHPNSLGPRIVIANPDAAASY